MDELKMAITRERLEELIEKGLVEVSDVKD